MSVNQLVMFMILFLNSVSWGLLVNCQWWTFIWNYYFWRGHIFLMLLFYNMWRDLGMWIFVGYGSDMILSASINWKFGSVFAISQAWLFYTWPEILWVSHVVFSLEEWVTKKTCESDDWMDHSGLDTWAYLQDV